MSEDKEIAAMGTIAKALDQFTQGEEETLARVLTWACARYRFLPTGKGGAKEQRPKGQANERDDNVERTFENLADLYHAAAPKTDVERALVAGYWVRVGEKKEEFGSQEINTALKNLGHGVGNITDAFESLISRKPAFVMQTAKSGTSRQARKKYKLTISGVKQVEQMIAGTGSKTELE